MLIRMRSSLIDFERIPAFLPFGIKASSVWKDAWFQGVWGFGFSYSQLSFAKWYSVARASLPKLFYVKIREALADDGLLPVGMLLITSECLFL